MTLTHEALLKLDRNKLNGLASERGIKHSPKLKKEDLVILILEYEMEHMTAARIPGIDTDVIEANQPTLAEVNAEVLAMTPKKGRASKTTQQNTSGQQHSPPINSPVHQQYAPSQQSRQQAPVDRQQHSRYNQPPQHQSAPYQVQPNTLQVQQIHQPQQYPPQQPVQPPVQQQYPQQPVQQQYQQPPIQQYPQQYQQTPQQYTTTPPQQPIQPQMQQQPPREERHSAKDYSSPKTKTPPNNDYYQAPQQSSNQIDKSRASYFEENTKVYSKPEATQAASEYRQKGILDIHPESTFGFMRQREFNLGDDDIYVSQSQIKKFNLRTGDLIEGYARTPKDQERYPCLVRVELINGLPFEKARLGLPFEKFVPIYPNDRIVLETTQFETSTRLIDLFSPIGRGQRGIIVAKPKAGKTTLLKKIANAVAEFNGHCINIGKKPVHVIALLIDERPEEVTDFKRSISGEVISSTFDEKPENHIQVAELTLEYAKRKVENGEHVLILLDSLTRLARAYNLTCPSSGKTLTGGLDPNSLHKPKRFLGSARNLENGGSLTIICTALIETGSRLDDIIYEEFKGTANMEVHLDRGMADRRIFPAIDVIKSGTRHEELLYTKPEMDVIWRLRKITADLDEAERLTRLITRLVNTKNNAELLMIIHKAAQG